MHQILWLSTCLQSFPISLTHLKPKHQKNIFLKHSFFSALTQLLFGLLGFWNSKRDTQKCVLMGNMRGSCQSQQIVTEAACSLPLAHYMGQWQKTDEPFSVGRARLRAPWNLWVLTSLGCLCVSPLGAPPLTAPAGPSAFLSSSSPSLSARKRVRYYHTHL